VSVQVSKLVWAYGPYARSVRMLLLAIAEHADDEGKAFPGLVLLAQETRQSERNVERLLAQMEREGWVRVERRSTAVQTQKGRWERRGNTYYVNLAKLRGVVPAGQGQRSAAGAPRTQPQQMAGQGLCAVAGSVVGNNGWPGSDHFAVAGSERQMAGQGLCAVAGSEADVEDAVESAGRDDKTSLPRRQNEPAEPTISTPRADISGTPLMNHHEPPKNHQEEPNPPYAPPAFVPACGKSQNADQRQEQTATARATAAATASALRGRRGDPGNGAGNTGQSLGGAARAAGNVIPFARAGRERRDPEVQRAALDGEGAALFDETMRVLGWCGIAVKNTTRRQRDAVSHALRAYADEHGHSLARAGDDACRAWQEYLDAARQGLLRRTVEARRFFEQGYWLSNGTPWDWDQGELKQRRNAGIGMR
jgi:hypothetical protein